MPDLSPPRQVKLWAGPKLALPSVTARDPTRYDNLAAGLERIQQVTPVWIWRRRTMRATGATATYTASAIAVAVTPSRITTHGVLIPRPGTQ